MTGTAKTEEDEFISIYKLDVVSVPTNKPMIREDMDDFVFATEDEKFEAISLKVKELYEKGQPVLVGTASINKSEKLSSYFKKHNIPHVVLNAKNHSKEAEIIAQAGRLKTVTIATNMAGRGTDIILGGNIEHQIATLKDLKDQDKKLKIIEEQKINNQKVKDLGGLFVIGSERHESRRIDNQLRGRSGRQGDIGSSQFYLSLEDDLLRIFGGEKIKSLLMKVGLKKGEVINHSFLNTVIRKAQEKVENYNFDIRKNLLQYDNVINDQRIVFYSIRRSVVENSANFKSELIEYYTELCEHFDNLLKLGEFNENGEVSKTLLSESLSRVFPIDTLIDASNIDLIDSSEFYNRIKTSAKNLIEKFYDKQLNQDSLDMIRSIFLHCLDSNWKDHLHSIDSIKSSISLRSYAQKDPLNEYKIESYHSFDQMLFRFKSMVLFSSLINFWKNIEFN
jgi:preprotein translocase subunit SecA